MARLIVEACTGEMALGGDVVYNLLLGVSVSRADDGKPVTGLTAGNFRLASDIGVARDFKVLEARELMWEPSDTEPSGCYQIAITMMPMEKFLKGERYVFGIQVRTPLKPVDFGQTIVELISTGT